MTDDSRNFEQEIAQLRQELADAHTQIEDLHDALDGLHADGRFSFTPKLTETMLSGILQNLNAELHGRKEGEVIIRSETPHLVGGNRTVIDETHKNSGSWESRESGKID